MFCVKCGKPVDDGAKFCGNCGMSMSQEGDGKTKKHKLGCLSWVGIICLLIIAYSGIRSCFQGDSEDGKSVDGINTSAESVGQTMSTKSVSQPSANDINKSANSSGQTMSTKSVSQPGVTKVSEVSKSPEVPKVHVEEVKTPESFCGIKFAENLDVNFPDSHFVDNSKDRTYAFSYRRADVSLERPFRNFTEGKVFAAMTSRKIYKIQLRYNFPRGTSAAVDSAEYKGTLEALKKKFGARNKELKGFGGDMTNVFKIGDVEITLNFVTEGVIDCGHLVLTAENVALRKEAELECKAYYEERSKEDLKNMQQFKGGGVDAL